ncbi:MAG: hypothetical protein ACOCQR_01695 [bacterium]
MKKDLRFLPSAITRAKKKLIKVAEESGIYENFGQIEVRRLRDDYIDSSKYTEEMNNAREMVNAFDEWCMTFNL